MKWEKISAIAEISSSIAILITLIYLAIQTQQTTAAIQANSRAATANLEDSVLSAQTNNPEIWVRSYSTDLHPEEKAYFHAWLVQFFRLRQLDWANYQSGALDARSWEANAQSIEFVLANPNFRRWWMNWGRDSMDPALAAHVDARIANTEVATELDMVSSFD